MSTKLDILDMTDEEYQAFGKWYDADPERPDNLLRWASAMAGWAACAKLYREKLHELNEQHTTEYCKARSMERLADKRALRIKELEAENKRAWGEYNEAQAIAAKNQLKVLDYVGRLKVAEADLRKLIAVNDQLRADAARYAFLRDDVSNSLHLTRNGDHACNYVTAEKWIEEYMGKDAFDDAPPEEIQRMKDTNTIWALQCLEWRIA
jgi:hypothetical protein